LIRLREKSKITTRERIMTLTNQKGTTHEA
jgi:hypothetical protein